VVSTQALYQRDITLSSRRLPVNSAITVAPYLVFLASRCMERGKGHLTYLTYYSSYLELWPELISVYFAPPKSHSKAQRCSYTEQRPRRKQMEISSAPPPISFSAEEVLGCCSLQKMHQPTRRIKRRINIVFIWPHRKLRGIFTYLEFLKVAGIF
jgi:hypothetical protein